MRVKPTIGVCNMDGLPLAFGVFFNLLLIPFKPFLMFSKSE